MAQNYSSQSYSPFVYMYGFGSWQVAFGTFGSFGFRDSSHIFGRYSSEGASGSVSFVARGNLQFHLATGAGEVQEPFEQLPAHRWPQ